MFLTNCNFLLIYVVYCRSTYFVKLIMRMHGYDLRSAIEESTAKAFVFGYLMLIVLTAVY